MTLPLKPFVCGRSLNTLGNNGFTLLECLIVLSWILFLTVTAGMSLRYFLLKESIDQTTHVLWQDIAHAQTRALAYHQSMAVCSFPEWADGWIVRSGTREVWIHRILKPPVQVEWISSWDEKDCLKFETDGTTAQQGHFRIMISHYPALEKRLIVIHSGRVKIK